MPRSKLKNSKSNSNKKIRDSKLRNNRGEGAGQSTTRSTKPKIPTRGRDIAENVKKPKTEPVRNPWTGHLACGLGPDLNLFFCSLDHQFTSLPILSFLSALV